MNGWRRRVRQAVYDWLRRWDIRAEERRGDLVDGPVRLCCGQRHTGAGVRCPDGLVMCCLCFERVPVETLARRDGTLVDVCRSCVIVEEGLV